MKGKLKNSTPRETASKTKQKNSENKKVIAKLRTKVRQPEKKVMENTKPFTVIDKNRSLISDPGKIWEQIGDLREQDEFRVSCIRPDDLLVCNFIFDNLKLETTVDGTPRLVRQNPSTAATLIVELPPQSFGEEAFLDKTGPEVSSSPEDKDKFPETTDIKLRMKNKNVEVTDPEELGSLPIANIRMSGRSRLAFAMPEEERDLSFEIESILDACRRWPMRLDVNAVTDTPRFRVKDFATYDKWFQSVVTSGSWVQATEKLVNSLGGSQDMKQALAGASRRIATKTVEAVRSGSRGIEESLRNSMNVELDVLMDRFEQLRDGNRREFAATALSFTTAQAVALHRAGESMIDNIKNFPFLPIIFSPHPPARDVTALELPYRLIISPVPESNWHHSIKPVVRNGRTEMWHTRLTSSGKNKGPDLPANVRALWSPDYKIDDADIVDFVNNILPYRMSLDAMDRKMLVKLMSGFNEKVGRNSFYPKTARSNRLSLSSLGALLDVEGNWEQPTPVGVGLEEWRHIATLGRDHYVRVVYRGFLCPTRHAASLIKVTERKFEFMPDSKNRVAVLRQRFFIVVREPVKQYDGNGHEFEGRNFPFTEVEILTKITPNLLAPDNQATNLKDSTIYNSVPKRACFWPMINKNNSFLFQIAATDCCGQRVTFKMPLLFIGKEANEAPTIMPRILTSYNSDFEKPRRSAPLGNASLCYAPADAGSEGKTQLPTSEMVFYGGDMTRFSADEANFYPEVQSAKVGIAAIQRLLQKPDATVNVTYPNKYKKSPGGFGAGNPGELFLKLLEPFSLDFGEKVKSDALGGLATPSMAILGLSRIMGPVSAKPPADHTKIEDSLGSIINNNFNPADFFKDAKILGGVDLGSILDVLNTLSGANVPKLLSTQLPDKVEASFDWSTEINKSDLLGLFVPNAGGRTRLEMHGLVSAPIASPSATTFIATASIENFKINLFAFVTIWFDMLKFTAKTGAKPDVAVDLHPGDQAIEFGGPLEFVNEIRKIIPSNGFSDPPGLTVTPSGISASYSINIPNLSVGIFALENLSLGAGFLLPFDSKPAEVRFNFAERQRPFSLTVSLLGGGGFFAIGVGTDGVREIEAAIEFGAALSINLGVASGSVEVKAGIYFHWQQKSVELAGYIRIHGELSVLGLISASLTFNLQLAYLKDDHRSVVWGEATLEVDIDILFLSFSVSVKCRREFGGSEGDPKFIELIPDQSTWTEYCQAFAKEAA